MIPGMALSRRCTGSLGEASIAGCDELEAVAEGIAGVKTLNLDRLIVDDLNTGFVERPTSRFKVGDQQARVCLRGRHKGGIAAEVQVNGGANEPAAATSDQTGRLSHFSETK